MAAESNLIGTLETILARVEDNAEKTLKILNARPALQLQRLTDYAEGVNFGLEIARNEIKAEIEIIKQVHQ
jgi:hypothetical protein